MYSDIFDFYPNFVEKVVDICLKDCVNEENKSIIQTQFNEMITFMLSFFENDFENEFSSKCLARLSVLTTPVVLIKLTFIGKEVEKNSDVVILEEMKSKAMSEIKARIGFRFI